MATLTAARAGIPASGVAAVTLRLTATAARAGGYLTAWAHGSTRPGVSQLNFVAVRTVSNLAVVPVDATGALDVYNGSSGTTRLIAEITGYYRSGAAGAAGGYVPLAAARVLDTRSKLGAATLTAGGSAPVQVAGRGGLPTSGVGAVALNLTLDQSTWTTTLVARNVALAAIDCTTTIDCVAVGSANSTGATVAQLRGSTWTTSSLPTGGSAFVSVSCTSSAACVALDGPQSPGATTLTSAGWGTRVPFAPPNADTNTMLARDVACGTSRYCLAVGSAAGSPAVQLLR